MARTALTVTNIVRSVSTAVPAETTADVVNGNTYANDDHAFVTVRNAHATVAKTLTVSFPNTVDGQSISPKVYSIPATLTHDVGPFPVQYYGTSVLINGESTDIKLTVRRLASG
jgi:hypothetical protein